MVKCKEFKKMGRQQGAHGFVKGGHPPKEGDDGEGFALVPFQRVNGGKRGLYQKDE